MLELFELFELFRADFVDPQIRSGINTWIFRGLKLVGEGGVSLAGGGGDLNFSKGVVGCIVTVCYCSLLKGFPVEFFDEYMFFARASSVDVAVAKAYRGGYFVVAPRIDRAAVDFAQDVTWASGQVEVSGIRSGNCGSAG